MEEELQINCECLECEAAVSPLAYLTDLLRYVTFHLEENGEALTIERISELFHQPFADLPAQCDDVSQLVHQVRLCCEVLRSYTQEFSDSQKDYCQAAYESLLHQNGTSYQELRLARTATPRAACRPIPWTGRTTCT